MFLLLTRILSFWEIFVFHQLICLGQLERKNAILHLDNSYLEKIFLSKYNSVLRGKQCVRCCSFYHRWISFERYMCVFKSAEQAYLEQKVRFGALTIQDGRHYSFQSLTQFSQGINVLSAAASNTAIVLLRDTRIHSTQLNRPTGCTKKLWASWKSLVTESIPFENMHNSHRKAICLMLQHLT